MDENLWSIEEFSYMIPIKIINSEATFIRRILYGRKWELMEISSTYNILFVGNGISHHIDSRLI